MGLLRLISHLLVFAQHFCFCQLKQKFQFFLSDFENTCSLDGSRSKITTFRSRFLTCAWDMRQFDAVSTQLAQLAQSTPSQRHITNIVVKNTTQFDTILKKPISCFLKPPAIAPQHSDTQLVDVCSLEASDGLTGPTAETRGTQCPPCVLQREALWEM